MTCTAASGQLVDVNLIEPLARLIESSTLAFDQLGRVAGRVGNRFDASAPRNVYRTADGKWLAISSASPNIAARVYRAIGRPDLAENPDYIDPVPRRQRAREVDQLVADWVARRTLAEAMAVFEAASVAAAPVYDAEQLLADEHLRARGTFVPVDDPDLGPMTVQAPVAVLTETPGRIAHLGRHLGADSDEVFGDLLGVEPDRLAALRAAASSDRDRPGGNCAEPRARRSELATPASSERMCEKAAGSGADLVFLDLEDACAPVAKEAARGTAVAALTGFDWGRTVRAVRVNGLETPWCHGDIIEVVTGARESLDVLIVPKARSARDVWWVDVLLTQLETKLGLTKRIGLEVLIEEAEGLANAAEIAGPATGSRPSSSGPATCRPRCGPGSTATSTRSASTPATSGTSPGSRS